MKPKVVRTDKSMGILALKGEHLQAVAEVVTTSTPHGEPYLIKAR